MVKIDEAVNVLIPFKIAVSTQVSPRDGAFCGKYGIKVVDFGCKFSVEGRCDGTHRASSFEIAVRSDDASAAG